MLSPVSPPFKHPDFICDLLTLRCFSAGGRRRSRRPLGRWSLLTDESWISMSPSTKRETEAGFPFSPWWHVCCSNTRQLQDLWCCIDDWDQIFKYNILKPWLINRLNLYFGNNYRGKSCRSTVSITVLLHICHVFTLAQWGRWKLTRCFFWSTCCRPDGEKPERLQATPVLLHYPNGLYHEQGHRGRGLKACLISFVIWAEDTLGSGIYPLWDISPYCSGATARRASLQPDS